jgi:hypothetical protein
MHRIRKGQFSTSPNCSSKVPLRPLSGMPFFLHLEAIHQRAAIPRTFYLHHSPLDYISPMTFDKNWFAAQQGRAA